MLALLEPTEILQWLDDFQYLAMFGVLFLCGIGLPIPEEAIASYEKVKDQIDLASMRKREQITKHDVKARLEEFCELAGHQHAHKGMCQPKAFG